MAKSKKQLHDELRAKYMEVVAEYLREQGEDILQTASNEIAIPCVDSEGNDEYLVILFKVPKGSKDEPYNAYDVAQDYAMNSQAKAEAKAEREAKKERKIAKDKAEREAKARAKAEAQAKKEEGE